MADTVVRDRFTFNAYDLFANFIPGTILVFGMGLPFFSSQGFIPNLSLMEAILVAILSFAAGLATQSVGSTMSGRKVFGWLPWSKRTPPFNEKMEAMLEADTRDPDFSNVDWATRELCIEIFSLNCDGNDNIEQVFKSMLAYLESSKWSRGLRIQSLHLASRGLYIVTLSLFIYYGTFAFGLFIPVGETLFVYTGPLSEVHFTLLSIGMISLSYVFFQRARHFESDVAVYILSEFFMSQYNWDQLDISDLEGVEVNTEDGRAATPIEQEQKDDSGESDEPAVE
ncbi:hypothetical protein GS429_08445 [Natronorubrum sp. JWXQ-INN-674]|uniref:Uncharacterized protein n=1 Tax=Natronorubrum halalkaliphilum TaxID=2691917 RepID=A0A6B0VNE6_9EURY|nr:hypothetical protein [Natronorubrum halalkaliphilum]MXV62089.1 hypothetical protein [Natronorubrum halalkaliphilum]